MSDSPHPPSRPGSGEAFGAAVVVLVAFGGFQAASADGAVAQSADWIRNIDLPTVPVPGVDLPEFSIDDILPDAPLWTWHGATPGAGRTVVIDIDAAIYPTDGVEWFVNAQHDRFDRHGPLDVDLGLWHSRPQTFFTGDVVSACWHSAGGDQHCPTVTIR